MNSKDPTNWNKLEMGIPLCDDEPIRSSWEPDLNNYARFVDELARQLSIPASILNEPPCDRTIQERNK